MKKYIYLSLTVFLLFFGSVSKAESVRRIKLSNGIKVYLLKDLSLPYVHYSLMIPAGSSIDPKDFEGLTYFTAQMLKRGSFNYTNTEIVQKLENLGTRLSITTRKDHTLFSADTLAWNHDQLLEIFAEVISRPTFLEDQILQIEKQILSQIKKWPESPSSFANKLLSEILFKNPSYHHDAIGYSRTVPSFTFEDIVKHYRHYFAPQHTILGITGQYPDDIKKKLEKHFSKWNKTSWVMEPPKKVSSGFWANLWTNLFKKTSKLETTLEVPESIDKNFFNLLIVNKPGAAQSEIRIAKPSVPRHSPDYLPITLANVVLGNGGLDSRLFNEVRENHGLTYSIQSQLIPLKTEGLLAIASPTRLEVTREAIDRIINVLENFYTNGITQEELEKAKNNYKISLLKRFETPSLRLLRRILLMNYGLPYDLDKINRQLNRIDLQEVNKIIKKYYSLNQLQFIILSDAPSIRSQFSDIKPVTIKEFTDFL